MQSWLVRLRLYYGPVVLNSYFVFLGMVLSYLDHFLTESQLHHHGYTKGTPFFWHWGVSVGDGLVMPFILVTIAAYSRRWLSPRWVIMGCIGAGGVFSALMHWVYALGSEAMPNCIAHERHLSPMGWVHFVYMWALVAALLLFYRFTPGWVKLKDMRWVSWLLALHIALGVLEPAWYAGDLWTAPTVWPTAIAGWALIAYSHWRLRNRQALTIQE